VQYSTDGTTWTTASATISASATSYSVTGLTNNTTYYFRVMAKDANGAHSTPNTTAVAVVPQTVLVVSEYSGALSNNAYSIAADPTGNVYVFESNCSVYEIPVSNPSTQTLLPGTGSNWCGSGRSYWEQMTFANLGGTPALVFMSYNDGHVYRYNLPSAAAPVVVGNDGNDPWGLSYDASSDTLYLGNYGAGATTSAVQEITSFSSCAGSCTSQDIPGIPASIWRSANAPFVSGGTLYLASYQGVQSIVLPSQANPHPSWSLPPDLSACAGGGYGSNYADQIAADAAGNIFFTCNYGKQLVEMRHGSTTLSVVPTSGTAFAGDTPLGLAYSQGSLYAINNLRHVVQISLPDAPVTPPVAQKPSAPIHLSTAAKGALVTLRWNAPRFPGSQPITSYTVRISGSSRTWVVSGRTWVNLIAGLNPKKYYTISIAATNSVGTGPAAILRHVKG
jgi:hypothetical protein